jgi:hypothetical protein
MSTIYKLHIYEVNKSLMLFCPPAIWEYAQLFTSLADQALTTFRSGEIYIDL